jgi:predicted amidophosphoribosyltransferase
MNCKNCNSKLSENNNFCSECGAKIVKERITVKRLLSSFFNALGWDSNFFITLRSLLSNPQSVLKEYISGTRKKYTNPFTFFAISLTISLFVYNQYSD